MREDLPVMYAAVLILLTFAACSKKPDTPGPIVLITVDTLRADHLGLYGYHRDTSPNIDRFAADAAVFENAVTTMATTLPAHLSLMTSTLTTRHGLKRNGGGVGKRLKGENKLATLAQILSEAGYETAAFVSAAPLKSHTGIPAGFMTFDEPESKKRTGDVTTDRVLEWLRSAPSRPFFLWVHYWDPHHPYKPPPPFKEVFHADDSLKRFFDSKKIPWTSKNQSVNNRYDGEILFVDSEIQRLFDTLRELDLWDSTAVVLTADHGEGLGQHGWVRHGRIYNEQLSVPLIVRLPDRGKGERIASQASLIDVVPTLVKALDIPVGEEVASRFQGIDLFDEDIPNRRQVFSERTNNNKPGWEPGGKYALTSRRWKYSHLSEGEDALYDMVSDREETVNVAGGNPEVARRMFSEIRKILAGDVTFREEKISEKHKDELRALGYIQ